MIPEPPERRRARSGLRRYPALAYLAGAAALSLLLPSGLNVLQSGPTTLAEYAPVPGEGEGSSDVGELAQASSAGVGSGRGEGPRAAEQATTSTSVIDAQAVEPGRLVRRPGTKRCVGDPPRQTEDPLSPPCIAFFEGDNGGATTKGVSRDEVRVVVEMEKTSTDPLVGQLVDCLDPPTEEDQFQDLLCKAYQVYFNERYQTYQRKVHLWSSHDVQPPEIDARLAPFAHLPFTTKSPKLGLFTVGYRGLWRADYQNHSPLLWTHRPDAEDAGAIAASYVCSKLSDRPARYAGDPLLRGTTRKFGFWALNPKLDLAEESLLAALEAQCGIRPVRVAGTTDHQAAARLKFEGVTTVIMGAHADSVAGITRRATASGFYPEWMVPGSNGLRGLTMNFYGRLADPTQWANAVGLTYDIRRGPLVEQHWYRAYREGCPDCKEPATNDRGVSVGAQAYESLAMLFYGIQSAGPRLTVENIDKGLHAIPQRPSPDPFTPAAYFAPGNYSFIKDAVAIWWDGAGTSEATAAAGCWILADGGQRHRANEWTAGDDDLRRAGPCQGDAFPGG